MTDQITLTGLVATTPRCITTGEGLSIASFRLASTQRRFDRGTSRWVDGDTNWYTITTFRQLAAGVGQSINKGERVIVTGRLRIREWSAGDKSGTNIEVDADALGHDLTWGTSAFSRVTGGAPVEASGAGLSAAGSSGAGSSAAGSSAARWNSAAWNSGGTNSLQSSNAGGDGDQPNSVSVEVDEVWPHPLSEDDPLKPSRAEVPF